MNQELIDRFSVVTAEGKRILARSRNIDRMLYMSQEDMMVEDKKLLEAGQLVTVRSHTRLVYLPEYTYSFVGVVCMYQEETVHAVDGKEIVFKKGELSLLNRRAMQETQPAGRDDIAVNFVILLVFFDIALRMIGEEEGLLRNFIVGCLCEDTRYGKYLHLQVAGMPPMQNLVKNLIWLLLYGERENESQALRQTTMGLLLQHLMCCTGGARMNQDGAEAFDQEVTLQVLRYIGEHYQGGTLTKPTELVGHDVYWLGRGIHRLLGRNYKELSQIKWLNQAVLLLYNTGMSVADASRAVGYDDTNYSHRIFRTYHGVSLKEYRKN